MYLKNLTVLGFKSFADKTSLGFMPGITAIVGPNGCGKSNIADAVRWVLGEQSAKALRGGEMADVIFTGTDNRKPMSMSEVSLTVGDIDQENLRASGIELLYSEVTLTRRVFRDGSSEYFINKTPCRLKDIHQLFMGTGAGRTSYGIMAQGHITQLLSSRPDDRRLVFEEAAGITRFKTQKREAIRKLESTEQNLLRIADLIREVKRQLGSLQRQAGKARRYRQLSLELQHLDTQLARHQFDLLQTKIAGHKSASENLRSDMEASSVAVLRKEDEIAQFRHQLSELEHQINQLQQQELELKNQKERHEGRVHFNTERLRELQGQNSKALTDISQAEERRHTAQTERAAIADRLAASTSALGQLRQALQAKSDALKEVESKLQIQQDALRRAQSDAFAAAQQLSSVRNEITALDLQKQGNKVRLDKLSSEKIQLEEERVGLETRTTEFASRIQAEQLDVESRRVTVDAQQRRLKEIQQELVDVTQALDELLRHHVDKRSRLAVLEQLQSEHEGFSAGALAALKQTPRILGALVDKIRVPDTYIQALEAALDMHLQLVLTEQTETAQQIIADLKAAKKGKASIAPLAMHYGASNPGNAPAVGVESQGQQICQNASASLPPELDNCGVNAVPALSVIEAEASIQPLLRCLLGQTVIVPDLESAARLWQQANGRLDMVTMNGEVLSRYGVFTGGAVNGSEKTPASILGRKNQIIELQRQLDQLQVQISQISQRKGALQSEQTALQAGLQLAQVELRNQEMAVAAHQGEGKALDNALRLLRQKVDTVVYEIQSLAEQENEISSRRQELASQLDALKDNESNLQKQIGDLNSSLEELRHLRDQSNNSLTETKVSLATEEQLSASFSQQLNSCEQRISELGHLVEQRREEIASILNRQSQLQTEIQESNLVIDSLQHQRQQLSVQLAGQIQLKDNKEQDLESYETDLRLQRQRLTDLQQQRASLDVQIAQQEMTVQNLRDRIREKYQVILDDVRSECITITIASDGPAKVETLTPEEMAARGLSTDWDAVASQVSALQKRIDDMGPVNLVAIEEYEETEQRYKFLSGQCDDLTKAKNHLLEVINHINAQTRQMFVETFNKVRENFNNLFQEVFGGGKADLVLVNEGDVLESGIDILARPPGKQLKTISLLSGGEQTMTAVALLFAIYQVKPSPFCVLDELDASLDDSNIDRFIAVLKRFLQYSQFIIITHSKRTISMADVIYGVTMQETGVSKIVSMKFKKSADTAINNSNGQDGAVEIEKPHTPPDRDIQHPSAQQQLVELTLAH